MFPEMIKEDFKNPILASVAATFPMALMLLSTYIKPFIGVGAKYIWYFAIGLHIILIVYFTIKFLLKLQMPKVFASYFIVYVGIAVAAVTAPAFEELAIGAGAFWFGFLTLIGLLVLVTIRYMKYKEIPEPAKPLFCIYAAPTSLCVAGYVQSVTPKSREFLLAMLLVATMLYVLALVKAISYLKLKRIFVGDAACGNHAICFGACESDQLSEAEILSKLCGIYLPICYQRDCNKADDGLSCEYEAADTNAPVCCSDRNGDCRIVYDLYLHSLSAVYFCRS